MIHNKHGKINGILLAMISGTVFKSSVAKTVLMAYTSVELAHDVHVYLMNRFKPKGDHQLQSLILKFISFVIFL